MKNYTECRVNRYDDANLAPFWSCYLSHIFFGVAVNSSFYSARSIGEWAVLDTGSSANLFPSDLQNYFYNNYFYIQRYCYSYFDIGLMADSFYCNADYTDVNKLPSINFIFNGYSYEVPAVSLFIKVQSKLYFKIYFRGSAYLLGQPFLENFHIVFDNDNNKIGFYGGGRFNYTNYTKDPVEPSPWITLLIVLSVILGIIVIIAIICILAKRKRNFTQQLQPTFDYQKFNNQGFQSTTNNNGSQTQYNFNSQGNQNPSNNNNNNFQNSL